MEITRKPPARSKRFFDKFAGMSMAEIMLASQLSDDAPLVGSLSYNREHIQRCLSRHHAESRILMSRSAVDYFVAQSISTTHNLNETCAYAVGGYSEEQHAFLVQCLIKPRQVCSPVYCEVTEESRDFMKRLAMEHVGIVDPHTPTCFSAGSTHILRWRPSCRHWLSTNMSPGPKL